MGRHDSVMTRRPVYPLGKGDSWMATIIERTESHNEAQEMPYGKAYVSYPETASQAICRCRSHGPGQGGVGVNAFLG